jgi:hypothetical protein
VAAQIKAQSEQTKAQVDQAKSQTDHTEKMAELQQEGQQRDADRTSNDTRAAMTLEGTRLKSASDTAKAQADNTHAASQAAADRGHASGLASVGLAQKHAQHTNELGLAAAGQQQQAAQAAQDSAFNAAAASTPPDDTKDASQ